MREGLFTAAGTMSASGLLSGPIFSGPVAFVDLVNFLQVVENTTIARRHS